MGSYSEHLGVAGGAGAFTKLVDVGKAYVTADRRRITLTNGSNANRRIVITSFKTFSTGLTLPEFGDFSIAQFWVNGLEMRTARKFTRVSELWGGGGISLSGASSGGSDISTAIDWQNTPFFLGVPLESFDLTFDFTDSSKYVAYTWLVLERES